jgi:hypothetical protein
MRALVEGQKVSFDVEADRRTGKSGAVNLREERSALLARGIPGALGQYRPGARGLMGSARRTRRCLQP